MQRNDFGFARRHPIVLFLYIAGIMVWTMITRHPVTIVVSLVMSLVYGLYLSGWGSLRKIIFPAAVLFVFTVLILPFFSHNGVTPLFYINGMAVTKETVIYGVAMSGMLLSVLQWCRIAGVLLDSEKILFLAGKAFPVIGLMLTMVFRALPRMLEQYHEIHDGQRGLGRDVSGASFRRRGRHLLTELSVLISWSLEDAMETSISMESRGYGTGGRTCFHLFTFRWEDFMWGMVLLLGYAGAYWMQLTGKYKAWFFPERYQQHLDISAWCALGILTVVLAAPMAADLKLAGGRKAWL